MKPRQFSELGEFGEFSGDDVEVAAICDDSRVIRPHEVFLCLADSVDEAERYILAAKAAGAVAIISIRRLSTAGLPHLLLDSMEIVGRLLRRWFATESSTVSLIGVTGTDGKSSVAWMLRAAIARLLGAAWSVGTLGWVRANGALEPLENTTPSLLILHQILAAANRQKVAAIVCEVSSHGIEQRRIAGLDFNAVIWTNLGHDHLDDHGGFDAYASIKEGFVVGVLRSGGIAVCNRDDHDVAMRIGDQALWYGHGEGHPCLDMRWQQRLPTAAAFFSNGESVVIDSIPVGGFHAENMAASALIVQKLWGVKTAELRSLFFDISTPPGRLELVVSSPWQIFVDFAHTPEALQRLLIEVKKLTTQRLLLLFGCGGDRDRGKRSKMGRIASIHADIIWITSDNPRSENAEKIIAEIQQGMVSASKAMITMQSDRKKAIFDAVETLAVGDTLVLAGKGHENYMEILGHREAWSDVDLAHAALHAKRAALPEVQACV
ncbi:MAG: UDP-N-acetylmuramoyl-L-alanyl-D-glutamate--2,6-diaminopimelate ligase [Mariprofundaceae bacterium]